MGMTSQGASTPSPLLPFCQFLLHRVKTDNLELLKRVVSEYFHEPSSFATIESMVRFAFPVVAVLPVDNDNAEDRDRADAILVRMKRRSQTIGAHVQDDLQRLKAALSPRVELKNWDWLQQMYDEFCFGDDRSLGDFVQLQQQAISIIPTRPVGSDIPPPHQEATPIIPAPSIRTTTVPDLAKETPIAAEVSAPQPLPNAAQPTQSTAHLPSNTVLSPRVTEQKRGPRIEVEPKVKSRVRTVFLAIEKQRPWEKVFDVTKIKYPFDKSAHPTIADSLKKFWERHARAVWERLFWYQYDSASDNRKEQDQRKGRQDFATRCFEATVISPLYQALGPQFFVELDARTEREYWWWYRTPVINMMRLGEVKCLEYLEANAFERFPATPSGLDFRAHKHNEDNSAMWAALAKYQPYRDEIDKIKRAVRVKKAAARQV